MPASQRLELLPGLARRALAGPCRGGGGRVPEAPVAQFAGHLAAGGEFAERITGADLEQGVEFLDAVAGVGVFDEGGQGE